MQLWVFQPERETHGRVKRVGHKASVLRELISTERDYLDDLRLLVTVWQIEVAKTGVLTQQETNFVFDLLPRMVRLSTELIDDLEAQERAPPPRQLIGECFLKRLPQFRLYIEYTARQTATSEILAAAKKNNKITALFAKLQEKAELKLLSLEDFLIKPTQRMTKYPLLLRDLAHDTDAAHADNAALASACEAMQQLLRDINGESKNRLSLQLLTKLQPTIVWKQQAYDLIASQCQLLVDGQMDVTVVSGGITEKGDQAFLFDACLLVLRGSRSGRPEEVATLPLHGSTIRLDDENTPASFTITASGGDVIAVLRPTQTHVCKHWFTVYTDAMPGVLAHPKTLVRNENAPPTPNGHSPQLPQAQPHRRRLSRLPSFRLLRRQEDATLLPRDGPTAAEVAAAELAMESAQAQEAQGDSVSSSGTSLSSLRSHSQPLAAASPEALPPATPPHGHFTAAMAAAVRRRHGSLSAAPRQSSPPPCSAFERYNATTGGSPLPSPSPSPTPSSSTPSPTLSFASLPPSVLSTALTHARHRSHTVSVFTAQKVLDGGNACARPTSPHDAESARCGACGAFVAPRRYCPRCGIKMRHRHRGDDEDGAALMAARSLAELTAEAQQQREQQQQKAALRRSNSEDTQLHVAHCRHCGHEVCFDSGGLCPSCGQSQ
eukprot:TRINITY_DN1859_c0_g1_i2.p1 TRINITY_DN1859_c0_g1~~TRINITY_DN1859_c0_g1_i2.p1  ORF type:complete len:663 (+),score=179.11 TRINITY_DN1859_c0_g1_i2:322-2310(+)